jgi:hypothetical protein
LIKRSGLKNFLISSLPKDLNGDIIDAASSPAGALSFGLKSITPFYYNHIKEYHKAV